MMGPNTEVDLNDVHQAIISALTAQFADLNFYEYEDNRKKIKTPACTIELIDMEPDYEMDPGTEQLPVKASFVARIILGFRTQDVKREVRKLSGAMASFINKNRFGKPIGPALVLSISPDAFEPDLDKYEVWQIEWTHDINLGQTVWINDGTIPTSVLASWEPNTGIPHENDYEDIQDGGP